MLDVARPLVGREAQTEQWHGVALLGAALVWQTAKLDRSGYTAPAIAAFYRFVWNLFYSEYLILPFI